jgi:hypothetical protein
LEFPETIAFLATAAVVSWSEFVALDREVPGSISGVTRFF